MYIGIQFREHDDAFLENFSSGARSQKTGKLNRIIGYGHLCLREET